MSYPPGGTGTLRLYAVKNNCIAAPLWNRGAMGAESLAGGLDGSWVGPPSALSGTGAVASEPGACCLLPPWVLLAGPRANSSLGHLAVLGAYRLGFHHGVSGVPAWLPPGYDAVAALSAMSYLSATSNVKLSKSPKIHTQILIIMKNEYFI